MPDERNANAAGSVRPTQVVTLDQFNAAAINDLTASLGTVDCRSLYTLFEGAYGTARAEGQSGHMAILQLLATATSIVLRPSDKGAEWGPWQSTATQRTPIPGDLRGEQSQVLAQVAPSLAHPGLRARLADLAWTNDRKLGASAALAIDSYCECAEHLVNGRSVPLFNVPGLAAHEALQYVERALVLGYVTRRKRLQPERTVAALKAVYAIVRDRNEVGIFVRAAELGCRSAWKIDPLRG